MIAFAAFMAAAFVAVGVVCFSVGALLERWRWTRRLELPRCWRCDGTGAEPYLERGLHERWKPRLGIVYPREEPHAVLPIESDTSRGAMP